MVHSYSFAVEQTTTLWSMVTGTQNPSIGLLGPAGAVGSGPGPDAITAATGQVATTSVAPPHVAGTTSSLLSAIYQTQPSLGPLDHFGNTNKELSINRRARPSHASNDG